LMLVSKESFTFDQSRERETVGEAREVVERIGYSACV
jgi:hypothetical protein